MAGIPKYLRSRRALAAFALGCGLFSAAPVGFTGKPAFEGMAGGKTSSDPAAPWIGIVGDSDPSGSATRPGLALDIRSIAIPGLSHLFSGEIGDIGALAADIPAADFFGISDPVEPLTRVFYSRDDLARVTREGDPGRVRKAARFSSAFDIEEHSFPYLVGRRLGFAARDIVMVSKGGARIGTLSEQFGRLREAQKESLPSLVFVSFNANDLCNPAIFTDNLAEIKARFQRELESQWDKILAENKPHPRGTRVVALAPLDIGALFTNQALLEQRVSFQGRGETTCREIRDEKASFGWLSRQFDAKLRRMCASVLGTSTRERAKVERIAAAQRAFAEAWDEVLKSLRARALPGFEWTYYEASKRLTLERGDLAYDCFHPGRSAHAKIARILLEDLFPDQVAPAKAKIAQSRKDAARDRDRGRALSSDR